MATPIVAGAVALIVEKLKKAGTKITAATVKTELLKNGLTPVGLGVNIVGQGRLVLNKL